MSRIISANKLNRFWKNGILPIKNLITNKIKTKDDLMANTVEGYIPDALAVKQGFQELNDSLDNLKSASFQSLVLDTEWACVTYERDKNYLIALHAIDGRALIGLFSTTYTEHFDILVNVGNMVCACNFDGGRFNFNNTNGFDIQFSMTQL